MPAGVWFRQKLIGDPKVWFPLRLSADARSPKDHTGPRLLRLLPTSASCASDRWIHQFRGMQETQTDSESEHRAATTDAVE